MGTHFCCIFRFFTLFLLSDEQLGRFQCSNDYLSNFVAVARAFDLKVAGCFLYICAKRTRCVENKVLCLLYVGCPDTSNS